MPEVGFVNLLVVWVTALLAPLTLHARQRGFDYLGSKLLRADDNCSAL